jgi:hypothetical protein
VDDHRYLLLLCRGRGDLPRLDLTNTTTLATIGTKRITQLQYLLQLSWPTSENSVKTKFGCGY